MRDIALFTDFFTLSPLILALQKNIQNAFSLFYLTDETLIQNNSSLSFW